MAGKNGDIRCSFCGKTQDQVRKLIAGPDIISRGFVYVAVSKLSVHSDDGKAKKVAAGSKSNFHILCKAYNIAVLREVIRYYLLTLF